MKTTTLFAVGLSALAVWSCERTSPMAPAPGFGTPSFAVTTLTLAGGPFGSTVSVDGTGWIGQSTANNIKRYDVASGSFTGDVPLGSLILPVQLASNQAGSRIYVAAFDESASNQGLVASINTSTLSIASSIRLTGDATGITATLGGDTVIVGMTDGPLYRIFLGSTPQIVASNTSLASPAFGWHFAWNAERTKLYASPKGANKVYELNPSSLAVLRTFSMTGQSNQGVALSADGSKLYVASEVANVFVFDLVSGSQLPTITTGCRGFDLKRHPTFAQLYVSCTLDGKVVVVNPSSGAILTTYAVGGKPREMTFDPGTGKIISPNENGWVDLLTPPVELSARPFGSAVSASGVGWVSQLDAYNIKRIDMATGAFTGDVFLGNLTLPVQIAANQAGTRIYTAAFDETANNQGLVASISTSTLSIVSSIRLNGDAQGIAATPAGDTVIVGMTDGPIHRVSLGGSPNVVVSKTGLPSALAYHFAWSPDRSKIYASSYGGNAVYELNPQTLATIRTFSVPGKSPQAIAVSSDGATLYIASEVADILVWNLASGLQGTTITTGCRGGGLVLVSSTRLFDSCTLDGKVVVVNPTTGLVVQTQITNGRPRELSFDAGTGKVIVPNETGGFVDRLSVP